MRNEYTTSVTKSEGKKQYARCRHGQGTDIKISLQETDCQDVELNIWLRTA
jgi:hypothetical protein